LHEKKKGRGINRKRKKQNTSEEELSKRKELLNNLKKRGEKYEKP